MSEKKSIFILPRYSLAFAIRFSGTALGIFVLLDGILWLVLNRPLAKDYFQAIATLNHLQESLPVVLLITAAIQATVIGVIMFLLSLYLSHAVAGPLVRFQKYFHRLVEKGPIAPISFRQNDQLQELAKAFNQMLVERKTRRDKFCACQNQAQRLITEYETSLNQTDTLEERAVLKKKLCETCAKMKEWI